MATIDAERIRSYLLTLPHAVETMQWGANLVFWVGDKAIGGKMFALVNLDADGKAVISYSAGPERYSELLEVEGIIPAPYMARIYWVAVERWDVFRLTEWEQEFARPTPSPSTNSRLKPAPPWPYRPPSENDSSPTAKKSSPQRLLRKLTETTS